MVIIDKQFLDTPWYGSRQMARYMQRQGHKCGRHRVRRLMRLMGSNRFDISVSELREMLSDPQKGKSIIYPNLPSRRYGLEKALEDAEIGSSLGNAQAIPPFYDCLALALQMQPGSLGLGIRGNAVQKYHLKPLKMLDENFNPIKIYLPMVVVY